MMDLPALSEMDWARNDKWTALMEAASFGQSAVVSLLLTVPGIELDAVNIRGQTAMEVAANRWVQSILGGRLLWRWWLTGGCSQY